MAGVYTICIIQFRAGIITNSCEFYNSTTAVAFISIILIIMASFDITEFTLWTPLLHRWISTPLPEWAIVRKVNNPIISGGTTNAYVHAYIYNKKFLLVCIWLFAQYTGNRHEKLINHVCAFIQQKYYVGKCIYRNTEVCILS